MTDLRRLPDITVEKITPEQARALHTTMGYGGLWNRVDHGHVGDFVRALISAREHSGDRAPPDEVVSRAIEIAELTFERPAAAPSLKHRISKIVW
jgi:hypothetical protein